MKRPAAVIPAVVQAFLAALVSTAAPTTHGGGTASGCTLAGVWNALGSGAGAGRLVNLTVTSQPVRGVVDVEASWWLPQPTSHSRGTFNATSRKLALENGLRASASASPYPPHQGRDCTLLTFSQHSVWCLKGYCEPAPTPTPAKPTPRDPMTLMPEYPVPGAAAAGALYPDGKPAYFYMNYTGASGYVIHLSGGGWRFVDDDGAGGAGSNHVPGLTPDGSGDHGARPRLQDNGKCYGGCDGILSDDPTMNPLFHSWNKVWIPISGTSFTGDAAVGPPYIRGKRIQTAVIAELLAAHGMAGATNIILTGGSSGGLAVYLTCDRVADQVRAANPGARFTCLADAGHFLHHDAIDGSNATAQAFKRSYTGWNASGGTNQACVRALRATGEDWKCIFAQYVTPFIRSELYAMQNLYDSWQVNNILHIGCSGYNKPMTDCTAAEMTALQQYGADMRTALEPLTARPGVGMFMPSCIAHCQSVLNEHPIALWYWPGRWSIVDVGNRSLYPRDAFNAWYAGNATGDATKHVQQCEWDPVRCNKLCPDWT